MRRSVVARVALLAVSAALNVLLLGRGRSETPPAASRRAAPDLASGAPARLRELETDKRVLAAPREKLRRFAAATTAGTADFNDLMFQLEYGEASLEIQRPTLGRSEPRTARTVPDAGAARVPHAGRRHGGRRGKTARAG
jgi:hypothetical protein